MLKGHQGQDQGNEGRDLCVTRGLSTLEVFLKVVWMDVIYTNWKVFIIFYYWWFIKIELVANG